MPNAECQISSGWKAALRLVSVLAILCGCVAMPPRGRAQEVRWTIDLAAKQIVNNTNSVAVRESVPVRLVNIGNSSAGDLSVRLYDITNQLMAISAAFTNVPGTNQAMGTLDLNTVQLVTSFSNFPAEQGQNFNLVVWDAALSRALLNNANIYIQNTAFAPGQSPSDALTNVNYLTGSTIHSGVVHGVYNELAFSAAGSNIIAAIAAAQAGSGATQWVFVAVSSSSNFLAVSSRTGAVLYVQGCVTNGGAGGGSGAVTNVTSSIAQTGFSNVTGNATFYGPGGKARFLYALDNYFEDGGHAGINYSGNRIDFVGTNRAHAVMDLKASTGTNLFSSGFANGFQVWNYSQFQTSSYPANIQSASIFVGVHGATSAVHQGRMYGLTRGTNDTAHDLLFDVIGTDGNLREVVRMTHERNMVVSGGVFAADGFVSSNVVAKTGDTMTGKLIFNSGVESILVTNGGFLTVRGVSSINDRVQLSPAGGSIPASIFFDATNDNANLGIATWTNGLSIWDGNQGGQRLIVDQLSASWLGIISNVTLLGGITGGRTNSTLTINGSSLFSSVATNGTGNVVTNLTFGGAVITQQLGTVTGGSGGNVYSTSNNTYVGGTTQSFDIVLGSNLTLRSSGNQLRLTDVGGTVRFTANLTNTSAETGLQYIFDSPDEQHIAFRRAGTHSFMLGSGNNAADWAFGSDMEGGAGNIWNRSSSSPNYANVGMNLTQRRSDSTHVSWTFVAFSNSFATGHKMMDMTFYRVPNSAQSHGWVTVNSGAGASTGHINTHFNVLGTGGVFWAFYVDSTSNTTRRARSPRTIITTNTINVRYTNTFGRAIRVSAQISMTNTTTEMSAFELHTTGNLMLDRAEHRAAASPDEKQDVLHSPIPVNVEDWWIITNKSVGAATGSVVTTIYVND